MLSFFSRNFNCSYSAIFGFDCVSSVSPFEHLKDIKELLGAAHKLSWLITVVTQVTLGTLVILVTLVTLVTLDTSVTLFWSPNQFYKTK